MSVADIGMVEYDIQTILKTAAVIILIFLPLLIILCCVVNVIVRKIRGEGSSASWRYLNSLERPRRASVSKTETTPLKSAATLVDADSALGVTPKRKEEATLEKSAPSAPPANRLKEDPDHAYDGVYYTNEPIPGKPNVDFEDKVWDFDDEDVFKSKSNSSLSSPLSGRQDEPSPKPMSNTSKYAPILKPSVPSPSNRSNPPQSSIEDEKPPALPKSLPPTTVTSNLPVLRNTTFSNPPPLPQTSPPRSPTKGLPPPLIPSPRNSPLPSASTPSPVSSNASSTTSGVRVNKNSRATAI